MFPQPEVFAYSARGAQPQSVHREPPALLCPPSWKTSGRNLINLLFAAPTLTKHLSFFARRSICLSLHFKSCAHSSKCWIHRTLHGPWLPAPSTLPASLPSPAALSPGLSLPHDRQTSPFQPLAHTSATLAGAACIIQDSCWVSRLREAVKTRIQGGKGRITPRFFSEQDRAIPGPIPLRQSSASPE